MNYELAKELKEVGFTPLHTVERWMAPDGKYIGIEHGKKEVEDSVYTPTLSELIEAVGEELALLINAGKWWFAQGFGNAKEPPPNFIGKTPQEAVAKLYIALNK